MIEEDTSAESDTPRSRIVPVTEKPGRYRFVRAISRPTAPAPSSAHDHCSVVLKFTDVAETLPTQGEAFVRVQPATPNGPTVVPAEKLVIAPPVSMVPVSVPDDAHAMVPSVSCQVPEN
jgi:hypothetical protein